MPPSKGKNVSANDKKNPLGAMGLAGSSARVVYTCFFFFCHWNLKFNMIFFRVMFRISSWGIFIYWTYFLSNKLNNTKEKKNFLGVPRTTAIYHALIKIFDFLKLCCLSPSLLHVSSNGSVGLGGPLQVKCFHTRFHVSSLRILVLSCEFRTLFFL